VTVRSAVLAAGTLTTTNAWTTIATVPAGQTWIIKTAIMYNAGAASSTVWGRLRRGNILAVAYFVEGVFAVGSIPQVSGYAIAEAGDVIELFATQQPIYYWWSGSKLGP
jgi:hypothetical protein